MPIFTLVTVPRREHVSPLMRPAYLTLARLEPRNDGNLLWYDQIPPGSHLLGYLDADHWVSPRRTPSRSRSRARSTLTRCPARPSSRPRSRSSARRYRAARLRLFPPGGCGILRAVTCAGKSAPSNRRALDRKRAKPVTEQPSLCGQAWMSPMSWIGRPICPRSASASSDKLGGPSHRRAPRCSRPS